MTRKWWRRWGSSLGVRRWRSKSLSGSRAVALFPFVFYCVPLSGGTKFVEEFRPSLVRRSAGLLQVGGL